MRKINRVIWALLIFLALWASGAPASSDVYYSVRRVFDGDTIELENGIHVRYIGINAPEVSHPDKPGEAFGPEALAFNEKMVLSKQVRIQGDLEATDPYNRRLAYVFLQDGTFVNMEMVRTGLAHVLYKAPNSAYDATLLKSQQEAMKVGKGMWGNWKEKSSDYIGNRNSRRFHLKTCALGQRTSQKNRIHFGRKWDAFWEGYAPCNKCMGQGAIESGS